MKIFDGHGDLFADFTVEQKKGSLDVFNKKHLDNFRIGNVNFAVFNVWIDDETVSNVQRAIDLLSYGIKEIYECENLKLVTKYQDFDFNDSRVQFIIGLEGIDYLNDPVHIYALYQYGVRLIGLTWNHTNEFATSVTDSNDNGLSEKGIEAVRIMEKLGIVIDISHLSDKSASMVLDIAKGPVIASHSNVRNICGHKRNLSDELIKRVAASGGVIGMNSYPVFVSDNEDEKTIAGLIKHVDYIRDLVGIDYISFGFDFMDYLGDDALGSFIEGSPFMKDLKNQGDVMKLVNGLIDAGYSASDIEKITHKNMFRVLENVMK